MNNRKYLFSKRFLLFSDCCFFLKGVAEALRYHGSIVFQGQLTSPHLEIDLNRFSSPIDSVFFDCSNEFEVKLVKAFIHKKMVKVPVFCFVTDEKLKYRHLMREPGVFYIQRKIRLDKLPYKISNSLSIHNHEEKPSSLCCRKVFIRDRELEILKEISKGISLSTIASRLRISSKTVSCQKLNAMERLGISNNMELCKTISSPLFKFLYK